MPYEPPKHSGDPFPALSHIDARTFFLAGTFLIVALAALRLTGEIVLPVVLAFLLKMVFQPVMERLKKWHVPSKLAALLVILLLLGGIATLGTMISAPAGAWAEKLPANMSQLRERFHFLSQPMEKTQKLLGQAEDMAKQKGAKPVAVVVQGERLFDKVFEGTQSFAQGFAIMIIVLFFLLAAGDTFLRRLVEVLPSFQDKRKAVDISHQVEKDISLYLSTVTVMNALMGLVTAIIMWSCGLEDPVLWGSLAFLLNYIPILGPLTAAGIFLLVGLVEIDSLPGALLPTALYLTFHATEANVVTPLLLAKRFTLNPVLVILALVFWHWMWGFPGAVLAVPMLAITKIICDRVTALNPAGHLLAQ
ncbi:MAG: AI-2E family transporter [Alphaproteobacteria bacterium]